MKYLKIFEEFGEFQLDEISKEEYWNINDNPLVYIPESKVLEFKSKLSKEYKLVYGRSHVKDAVEFFRAEYETEVDYYITVKTFSIRKRSLGGDEPCYVMSYNYEEFTSLAAPKSHIETLPERISFQKKSYYRFEESDFNQMCENPQILLDYLDKNNMIKESYFDEVPEPEPMSADEWDKEVNYGKEVDFTKKEKELFIALSNSISVKNKINMSYIWKSHFSFELINGELNPKIKEKTPIRSTVTYKNYDEFYYVKTWERGDGDGDVKLYRCDGYKCWEKFLKEIFAGYRELISKQTKSNESIFNEIPDPEPMNIYEWDREVSEDKEVDFTQNEKELFIALADTIPSKHKIDALYIEDFQLSFSMVNGKDPIFPNIRFDILVRSITSYKMDDEFYYVNVWEGDDIDGGTKSFQSYRCDGYECWEKFLKEIFQGYRDLINTKDNKVIKESLFGDIPEPEPMSANEWDVEVNNAKEVDFTQKEKELFIALSDSISLKNKINQPETAIGYLSFRLINGSISPRRRVTSPIGTVATFKNDDEFYYLSVWEMGDYDTNLYRCDGYECWEKFLKEIFAGYRKLTKQTKTNKSL